MLSNKIKFPEHISKNLNGYKYSWSNLIADIKSDIKRKSGSSISLALYFLLFSPTVKVIVYYRISHWLYVNSLPRLAFIFKSLQSKYGCYISESSLIGKHLHLPHPVGIVIGEGAVIENDVRIYQHVTIGSHGRKNTPQEYPYICKGAKIYAGAVLIGKIKIGENAVIGANTVVLADVKENSVAVGVPYKS